MELGPYTQLCFVSPDLDRSMARWGRAGAGPFYVGDSTSLPPGRIYRGAPATDPFRAAIAFLGTTQIEIVQPLDDQPSFYREVMNRFPGHQGPGHQGPGHQGPGHQGEEVLHHVQPSVRPMPKERFDAECAALERDGFVCVATLTAPGGGTVRYYEEPGAQLGFFIEMSHKTEEAFALMDKMFRQHQAWDGADPVRAMHRLAQE